MGGRFITHSTETQSNLWYKGLMVVSFEVILMLYSGM